MLLKIRIKSSVAPNKNEKSVILSKNQIDNLLVGNIGGLGDKVLEKAANKLPSHVPYYANRAAVRSGNYLLIPIKEFAITKGAAALGIIGGTLSIKSVWDNYHSGYGFWEATGRSSIDILVAGGSIVAGALLSPVGGILVGTALSGTGEITKNIIWGRKD